MMSKRNILSFIPAFLIILLPPSLVLMQDDSALDSVLHPRMFLLGIFLLLIIGLSYPKANWLKAFKSFPALFFLGFLLIESLSWLGHGAGAEAAVPLIKDVGFFLLFITVSSLDGDARKRSFLAWSTLISLLLVIGITVYENIVPNWTNTLQEFPFTELRGPMAHHNLLASSLLLLLPFSLLAKSQEGRNPWPARILGMIVAIATLALIYFTRSRSALLGAMAGAAVISLTYIFRKWIPKFSYAKTSLGILLLILLVPIFLVQYKVVLAKTGEGKALQSRMIETSGTEKSFTTGERLQMWDYSLAMIQDQGLLGVGPAKWRIEFPMYGSEVYRARQGIVQFQRPHNDYLWIWAETGPFGLLFYLAFVMALIQQAFRQMRIGNSNWSPYLLLAVLIGFLVVSVFSFPRERIFHQSLFMMAAGLLNSAGLSSEARRQSKLWQVLLFSILMLMATLFTYTGYERWQGEKINRKMIVAHGQANWSALIQLKEETVPLYFYQISPVGMPMEFYSGLAYLNQQNFAKALQEYSIARQLHSNNLQVINNLANTFALMGEADSALVYYRRATEISPYYKEGILNLASAYFNKAQSAQAYAVLREKAAEFDEDRGMYETYVLTIIRKWATEEGKELSALDDKDLIRLHYILAYDLRQEPALEYFASQSVSH
ncbi:O-antigen ligase family protein [Croceimicrobium hydrocarbonivorans]|uniref:O-antigen ligase family protein n=1 Tax=Croceimicrobium hydrocarbonivorans TaxID=2761580 RepID=A0A7H0VFL0_9FLAO|nr:O-antigen ligase family protein [Croceimicrobium hydrocarbonivorans]QNR24508.1 O-antigen ligase family protein [Croceimicrobium hydrocarbonivorans]